MCRICGTFSSIPFVTRFGLSSLWIRSEREKQLHFKNNQSNGNTECMNVHTYN